MLRTSKPPFLYENPSVEKKYPSWGAWVYIRNNCDVLSMLVRFTACAYSAQSFLSEGCEGLLITEATKSFPKVKCCT